MLLPFSFPAQFPSLPPWGKGDRLRWMRGSPCLPPYRESYQPLASLSEGGAVAATRQRRWEFVQIEATNKASPMWGKLSPQVTDEGNSPPLTLVLRGDAAASQRLGGSPLPPLCKGRWLAAGKTEGLLSQFSRTTLSFPPRGKGDRLRWMRGFPPCRAGTASRPSCSSAA